MAAYNRIIIMGNLTRDPEYKQLASGQAVCRLGLASNRQFRNKQSGEMVQEVCYIDVDVWGPQAESCKQYLSKGRPVLVEGRIKLDSWQDQDGNARSKHSIVAERVVFLSSAAEAGDSASQSTQNEGPFEPRNEVERELMSQLDDIKSRKKQDSTEFGGASARRSTSPSKSAFGAAKPAGSKKDEGMGSNAGAFKDEPPFQDDLPF